MNRRDLFRSAIVAPALATIVAAKEQANPLTRIQRIRVPEGPKKNRTAPNWDVMVSDALERLEVRLLGLECFGFTAWGMFESGPGYVVNIRNHNATFPVVMDSLYSKCTEDLSQAEVDNLTHWDLFKKHMVPLVDSIADQILKAWLLADEPKLFVSGKLLIPGGLEYAASAEIKDKLSLRMIRSPQVIECREYGAQCEMMYDFVSNNMVPVKKPFTYITRLDVLGGFARRKVS